MAKAHSHYVCQQCGAVYARWQGRCEACGGWNSVIEEPVDAAPRGLGAAGKASAKSKGVQFARLDGPAQGQSRRATGIGELDRVTGGGLVAASAVLVGGDPGIGKSTLLLQAAARLAGEMRCAYVSGEESIDQVRMRAARMGLAAAPVELAAATSVREIAASLDRADGPGLVVIDSIQTMYLDTLDSAPGTVAQVRASSQELIRIAKRRGTIVVLVGHVTKEGQIAGPRVLEHMVDTVLYFEGERGHQFRILRAVKNRFGPTDEIGVFEMTDRGLMEVQNPSSLFLTDRERPVSGAAVFAGIEGTRPMLVEVQALVSPASFATPRRAVVGWDGARLAMVLAVLEARCGLALGARDVYLNVAGGLRINEPAADLAVAAALMSSAADRPVPQGAVVFGEIGLSGEVRPVNQMDLRLKEAARLGFDHGIVPPRARAPGKQAPAERVASGLRLTEIGRLHELGLLFEGSGNGGAALRGIGRG
ncbi:MAG TPA: DNA repair protein RadA [Alphaproteobacteria bacterium]|nr:DNA repair protein RadA [Alphaproteobacteria bacterium]